MFFCKFKLLLIVIIFNFFFILQGYIYQFDIWTKWDVTNQSYRYMYGLYDCHIDFYKEDKEIGNEQWRLFIQELKKLPKEETVCIIEAINTQYANKEQFLYGASYAINTLGYKTLPIDYRNKSGVFLDISNDLYKSTQTPTNPFKITSDDAYKFLNQSNISFHSLIHEIETTIKQIKEYNDPQMLTEWYKKQIKECLQLTHLCIYAFLESIYLNTYSLQVPFWQFLSDDRNVWYNFLVAISRLVDCKAMHEFFRSNQKYAFIIMGGAHLENSQSMMHALGWELLFSCVGKKINNTLSEENKTLAPWLKLPKPSKEFVPYELFACISDHSKMPGTAVQIKSKIVTDHNKNKEQKQTSTISLIQFIKDLENKEFLPLPCLKACIRFCLRKHEKPFHFFIKKIDEQINKLIRQVEYYQSYDNVIIELFKKQEIQSFIIDLSNYIDALTEIKHEIMNFDEFIQEEKNSKSFFQWLLSKMLLQ